MNKSVVVVVVVDPKSRNDGTVERWNGGPWNGGNTLKGGILER